MALSQIERLHIVGHPDVNIPYRERSRFKGSTRGDCLGPIQAPAWSESRNQQVFFRSSHHSSSAIFLRTQRLTGS